MRSISASRALNASVDSVWAKIGHFGPLSWHPGIESGTIERSGSTLIRKLVAKGGSPVFTEQLLEKNGTSMRYKMVGGLPLQPVATLSAEPEGCGCRVTWSAEVDVSGVAPEVYEPVIAGITAFYEAGLNNL